MRVRPGRGEGAGTGSWLQDSARKRGGAGLQPGPTDRVDGPHRLEQLPHHAEGVLHLERRALRAQDRHARPAGVRDGGREQRRLADPRGTLDQQQPALACGDGIEAVGQDIDLTVAFQWVAAVGHAARLPEDPDTRHGFAT
jgi:hypothetical protein